jgi:uncharacterized protein (UPF0264 family)
MTRLLISVRSALEAASAADAGADLIDVKEPARGSLGAADRDTIRQVVDALAGRRPVSAAFGELRDEQGGDPATVPRTLNYAKIGLAGCALDADWAGGWQRWLNALPWQVQGVAVAYADNSTAQSPDPYEILRRACDFGCAAVLVDTFDKMAGGLLDAWPLAQLERFVEACRTSGRRIVLAGSLTEKTIRRILPLRPDFIAVRGAACSAGRAGTLDPEKVRHLVQLLKQGEMHHGDTEARRGAEKKHTSQNTECGLRSKT